jgi:hypothetical protein
VGRCGALIQSSWCNSRSELDRINTVEICQPKAFEKAELTHPKFKLGDAGLRYSKRPGRGRLGEPGLLAGGG